MSRLDEAIVHAFLLLFVLCVWGFSAWMGSRVCDLEDSLRPLQQRTTDLEVIFREIEPRQVTIPSSQLQQLQQAVGDLQQRMEKIEAKDLK